MEREHFLKITRLIDEVEKVVLGKREVVQLTIAAMLASGHVLFEDVPGVGKTVMVKAIAKAVHGDFSRIQFTPDLLPSDILGVSIFDNRTTQFEFRQGPIFTTILLADEINRTSPRTQAALLEAMSEWAVTIDGATYPLSENFFVMATQNPIDYEGTYPLPEAQLDRFLFKLTIGYPAAADELQLMQSRPKTTEVIDQVINTAELAYLKQQVDEVYLDEVVASYALSLVQKSREHKQVELGISPRGSMAFIRGAKAYALTEGRTFVTPRDLQIILPAVFSHRLLLKSLRTNQTDVTDILNEIIADVPVPVRR
ncbi:AAA family ATPase [Enterococcus sp. JM4C]|uniref:AAA family ATPase n=1 Tax=Candidatus Enterococcus huntleyi TaxID=1857217 RepID=UPI001379EEB6|nr:MoxR family ATPase [Enterococcus sp. JM4C]KAF1298860.1 AAA family ATPase [Enterococcus sp. JM4C]